MQSHRLIGTDGTPTPSGGQPRHETDRPITYATEYRDHKGQLLSSVAVHTSDC